MMRLRAMGINYEHDADFRIERENGSGDCLLLIFKTSAYAVLGGTMTEVSSGSAVLFPKGAPQIYGAAGERYVNHWVHFDCGDNDIFFDTVGAARNCPTAVPSMPYAERILEMLSEESVCTPVNEDCIELLIKLLIAKTVGGRSGQESVHSGALRRIRAEIYASPAGKLAVPRLAEKLALSPAYFQTLYKREFGVSCYEDVLRAKTELAKYYLKNTDASVHDISALCGDDNDVHFMRRFKKRVGITAMEYRKAHSIK